MNLSQLLCTWQKAICLIIAITLGIFFLWLFRQFREFVWRRSRYSKWKIATFINNRWGIVFMLGALLFAASVVFIVILMFGEEKFVEGIVVATPLTVFSIFQLPRLLKPHINVAFLPADDEGAKTQLEDLEKPLSSISLHPNEKHTLHVYISNLGVNIYENWEVDVVFDCKIHISGFIDSAFISYREQKRNNAVICHSSTNMPYGPDDNLLLSITIKTPAVSGKYPLIIAFKCATRWGETRKELTLNVEEHNL